MRGMAIQFVLATLACAIVSVSPVRSDGQKDASAAPTARVVMDKAIGNALVILRDRNLSADQKREKVQQVAFDNISFDVMARLSLGRFWRDLGDAQRTQFQQEFKQLVTNTYIVMVDSYTDQDIKIFGDRKEEDGDWTVQTRITGTNNDKPNQQLATVDYRLRKQDDQWKVIDFTVDNVSLVANFRSQFQETMSNGGIDQLLKLLHEKNASHEK
jgi:phospholipid transport system substrate-binding protein